MPKVVDICKCGHEYGEHKAAFFGPKPCESNGCPCSNYEFWRRERRPGW